jgi:hypothetical protein
VRAFSFDLNFGTTAFGKKLLFSSYSLDFLKMLNCMESSDILLAFLVNLSSLQCFALHIGRLTGIHRARMSSKPKREDVCTQSSKDFCTVVVIVNQVAEFGRMKYCTVFQVLIIAALTIALFVNSKPLDGLISIIYAWKALGHHMDRLMEFKARMYRARGRNAQMDRDDSNGPSADTVLQN